MTTHETSINPFIVPETNFSKVDTNLEYMSREDHQFGHLERNTQNTQQDNSGILSKHIGGRRFSDDSADAASEEESMGKKLITAEGLNRKQSLSRHSTTSQRQREEDDSDSPDEKQVYEWVDKIEPRLTIDWLEELK